MSPGENEPFSSSSKPDLPGPPPYSPAPQNTETEPEVVFRLDNPREMLPGEEPVPIIRVSQHGEDPRKASSYKPPLRTIHCERCQAAMDVSRHNPLDKVTCEHCKASFSLLREFDRYVILDRLGVGGTSCIYIARDTLSKQLVALKILSAQELLSNTESVRSFSREIETGKKFHHPNVVDMFHGGIYRGFHYMALELVEGLTLRQILSIIQDESQSPSTSEQEKKDGPGPIAKPHSLPELACIDITIQTATGLDAARQMGIIHGDVKPENIMLTYAGDVKILDFGLVQFADAKTLISSEDRVSVQGTPLYIPPERVRGEPEDFRSDIYSLGATLYHLLSGAPPFHAKTSAELLIMHAEKTALSFHTIAPWVSSTLSRLVDKSLRKNLSQRYNSYSDFIADLNLARHFHLLDQGLPARESKAVLSEFMEKMPKSKLKPGFWKQASTTAIVQIKKLLSIHGTKTSST
ncbi:MAG: serine/threonine-protein kinase [Verrucomicrobiae bacterium]|nr:serine/threonine-protein kinase [Verrucomicrobiae bacterium]